MNSQIGQYDSTYRNPVEFLLNFEGVIIIPLMEIDPATAYVGSQTDDEFWLPEGTLMALITATKQWTVCKRTLANGAGTGATALIVDNAELWKAGDPIVVAAQSATTVASVDYATNTITLAAAKTWADNDTVKSNTGAETCRAILKEAVNMRDHDGVVRAKRGVGVISGLVNDLALTGDIAAVKLDTGAKIGGFLWGSDHGQV